MSVVYCFIVDINIEFCKSSLVSVYSTPEKQEIKNASAYLHDVFIIHSYVCTAITLYSKYIFHILFHYYL